MAKNLIKKSFLIIGIIIVFFSIFFDLFFKNNFYFGASQLILMLIGFSLILYFWSKKIFIWKTGLIIGIIVVSFNKQYFGLINESPILKKKTETFEKEIIGKLIDGSLTEIKKFFILSESFIDQNQFAKFFSYLYEDNNSIIRYSDISIST